MHSIITNAESETNQPPKLTERHLSSVHDAAEPAADLERPQDHSNAQDHKTNAPLSFQRMPEEPEQDGDGSNRNDRQKQNSDDGDNEKQNPSL